ncbi:hypothetical protein OEZ85_014267 [Tetradesmus obliquus]|uniref:Sugar phosphate transporter domain-containing protein n=1 Tax=Tetradesmus obliquus TaxID=3088 RepID=A0ABY8U808_TETOB|nr:hypothetical protein OEZ85_014267 [Tetradesmus obliquus]
MASALSACNTRLASLSSSRPTQRLARPLVAPGLIRPLQTSRIPQFEQPQFAPVAVKAAADSGAPKELDPLETTVAKFVGEKNAKSAVTLGFIALWYALNVYFNLLNKSIFKYFPFPYTVSTVHVVVGTAYCALVYLIGAKQLSFGRVSVLLL